MTRLVEIAKYLLEVDSQRVELPIPPKIQVAFDASWDGRRYIWVRSNWGAAIALAAIFCHILDEECDLTKDEIDTALGFMSIKEFWSSLPQVENSGRYWRLDLVSEDPLLLQEIKLELGA